MDVVETVIRPRLAHMADDLTSDQIKDAKSLLQELAQARLNATPRYRVVEESGPAHERVFVVEVLVGDLVIGRGEGKSKRGAEQDAARNALTDDGWRDGTEVG